MRYPTLALAGLMVALTGCDDQGNLTLGGFTMSPAERCILHSGAVARYERILAEGGELTSVQRGLYDVAIAGKAATCVTPAP